LKCRDRSVSTTRLRLDGGSRVKSDSTQLSACISVNRVEMGREYA